MSVLPIILFILAFAVGLLYYIYRQRMYVLTDTSTYNDESHNELIKKVRQIEIKTRGLSNQIFSGTYHSAFKGRGMSFSEVREYQYGDDIRNIDWNVTARFNNPFVKVYEEERELNVMLLIDISRSTWIGSATRSKRELIAEIAATLAFSAIRNNDKIGVIFFSGKIEKFIPLKKGKSHVLQIIRELLQIKAVDNKTDLNVALDFFNRISKKRSIAFIISDFISDDFTRSLQQAKKMHDIIGIHVHDDSEKESNAMNLIEIEDSESGKKIWIDTSHNLHRKEFANAFSRRTQHVSQVFKKQGIEFQSMNTGDSYVQLLINLFKERNKRK